MFIKLTNLSGTATWYNTAHIRAFYSDRDLNDKKATVLELTYGTAVVLETPEEIVAMLN